MPEHCQPIAKPHSQTRYHHQLVVPTLPPLMYTCLGRTLVAEVIVCCAICSTTHRYLDVPQSSFRAGRGCLANLVMRGKECVLLVQGSQTLLTHCAQETMLTACQVALLELQWYNCFRPEKPPMRA